jgi:hypothetical protein
MTGREAKNSNDIFFVCSFIEHIGRKTKNHRSVVVNAIGREKLQHIYDLADVYHSENIEKISDELVATYHIESGYFDNIASCKYSVPTIWDIGKVYRNLIINILTYRKNQEPINILIEVYSSWISRKIENFNSSMYYENPDYIFQAFLFGDVLV